MVERTDPADRLRAIGRDTPPLDADRLAAIEARVMTAVAVRALGPTLNLDDHDDRGRRRPAVLVLAAAAVLVLAVFALVALAAGREPDGRLVLGQADAVVVEAPGADPEPAAAGDQLDDGAIVEVGPGGSATVDGVVYGPGRYLVDGGALRPVPPASAIDGDEPGGGAVAPTTTQPAEREAPAPARSSPTRPTTTIARVATTIAAPPTRPPATTTVAPSPPSRPTTTVRTAAPTTLPARTTTTTTTTTTTSTPAAVRPTTTTSTPTTTEPARGTRGAASTTEPAR